MPSYSPNPGQVRATALLTGPQRHTLLAGGARSGKTFLLTRAVVVRGLRADGSRHAILRFRGNAARSSIALDTLPKVMSVCFPEVKLTEHRQDGFFELPNKSQIWIGGLDDKERVEKILGQEYCVDPDAKILTDDLRWVPASSLSVGDGLIGFPEDINGHVTLVPSRVERHEIIQAERYRIVTSRGATVVSAQHKFVSLFDDRRHKNLRLLSWRKACDLSVGDFIRYTTEPWESGHDREDGWFAGMLDGEGWASRAARQVGVAQCAGTCLDALREWFRSHSIPYTEHVNGGKEGAKGPCYQLKASGLWPSLRLLGIARPKRLDGRAIWEGCRAFTAGGYDAEVLAIEPLGVGPVVSMGTSSKTFIADGFLGHNCTLYLNECSQIPYSSVVVARTRLAQQVDGLKQRAYYDLNPGGANHWTNLEFGQHVDPVSHQPLSDPENYQRAFISPEENADNLSSEFLDSLRNLPTKQRKRFFEGEYIEEIDGALWTIEMLDQHRAESRPEMKRIVVAVDPSGCSGKEDERSDEVGIIVAGVGEDGCAYILEDLSGRHGPSGWAAIADGAYERWDADSIVAEVNYGGAMVAEVIRAQNPRVPFREVRASRGKHVRAEPVATLYAQGKVRHFGRFPRLEDQLLAFSTAGYTGDRSPDRADAAVWAISDLFPSVLSAERPKLALPPLRKPGNFGAQGWMAR